MGACNLRGFGTIFSRKGSRFLWMQYWHDGKRFRESTYCDKPKAANEILRKKLLELDRLAPTLPQESPRTLGGILSVSDLYQALEQDYVNNKRDSLENLRIRWRKRLGPAFGALHASSVTVSHIREYITGRQRAGVADGTINRDLAALRRCFTLAIESGILKLGERPYFPMLKENNVRKGFVKDAQYAALAHVTGEIGLWLRTLFELGFCYGWRKAELLGLRVSQVDMIERTIVLHVGETKNDDGRTVEMTGTVYELLTGLVRGKGKDDFVFTRTSMDGLRNKPVKGFRKAWAAATQAAGCPGLLFHDLRRSGVRNLVRAGVREKIAMKISGHKTRNIFDRYDISSPEDVRAAVALLEKAARARRQKGILDEQTELLFEDPSRQAKNLPPARIDCRFQRGKFSELRRSLG